MKIMTGVDSDKNLKLELSGMLEEGTGKFARTVWLTLRDGEVMQLMDVLESYQRDRREEFKAFWNANRKPQPVRQRISLEAMVDVFESLAESGEPFEVVFEKQDGSMREMRAMMLGPVQYSYSTRKRYANVTDLDISETEVNERKIVIQRVQSLIYQGYEFVPSGR